MEDVIKGVVERVTFHNKENAWTVLKFKQSNKLNSITVTVHQTHVFPGASLELTGAWENHYKHGQQFVATKVHELKPASVNALEKYIGSGMIYGVGPAIAKRIVRHFKDLTLDVFENDIDKLVEVKGISSAKIKKIQETWREHQAIRDVMMFLQGHEISTLLAIKIFKKYGDQSIYYVSKKPYQLAKDIYGIGFYTADKIALSIGYEKDSPERISAAISHCLSASREKGHCFLYLPQIIASVRILLKENFDDKIPSLLSIMEENSDIKLRININSQQEEEYCYYNKTLYYDEQTVAQRLLSINSRRINYDVSSMDEILISFNEKEDFPLSEEQTNSVKGIVKQKVAILTGGPGCGKTTTTKALVHLLLKLKRRVLLAAPTGRAAQRMGELIGLEAKTIHRLLEFNPISGGFKKNEEDSLDADILIIDEASMMDIQLTSSLLKAINNNTQLLFIGDVDQLPSVGAGNVLKDIIDSEMIRCFRLTKVFRQAQKSKIITYAHKINTGEVPNIISPFKDPKIWHKKEDCLFVDSEEATQDQLRFIRRCKGMLKSVLGKTEIAYIAKEQNKEGNYSYETLQEDTGVYKSNKISKANINFVSEEDDALMLNIPSKFKHINVDNLMQSKKSVDELKSVMKRIHPWSSIHYGFSATDMLVKLYIETISKYIGKKSEIQILSPMTKGSLGTIMLNSRIQKEFNPPSDNKKELNTGDKIFRVGDRVIQKKNNYDLEIFNGDIGKIIGVDAEESQIIVQFGKNEDTRDVCFEKIHLIDLDLAYAITIHKSQGSEFDVVILPISSQHYNMLFRNLIYTGLTRAKKLALFVGSRYALTQAVRNEDNRKRQTLLKDLLCFNNA